MEYHEIGERFEYNGNVLEVIQSAFCIHCFFHDKGICKLKDEPKYCCIETRNDNKSISYKLVKKSQTRDMEQETEINVEGMGETFATHTTKHHSNEDMYRSLLDKLFETYKAKNSDYGNAFAEMFDELGIDYAYGKLREKMNRIKVLRNKSNMVENEGLEDALLDTAGYAILTLVELKKRKCNGKSE